MAENDDKYDKLKNATGFVDTGTAATVTGYAGMAAPGMAGNILEAASIGLQTSAEEDSIIRNASGIADRLRMRLNELQIKSSVLRDDQTYTGGKYSTRYAGLGVKLAAAGAGGLAGGAALSWIPVVGPVLGATVGSVAGGFGGSGLTSFIFPEKPMSNTEVFVNVINAQDQGTIMNENVMMALGRKASPTDQAYIEQQVGQGNMTGIGMDALVTRYFRPLLGDDFYDKQGSVTAIEYLTAKLGNKEIDAAQMFLDENHMKAIPPQPKRKMGRGNEYLVDAMGDDGAFEGAGSIPMKARGNGTLLS